MAEDVEEIVLGILVDDRDRILLTDIPTNAREFPGMVGFPGGDIREDETPEEAISRLVMEDTNVLAGIEEKLGTIYQLVEHEERDFHRKTVIHLYELEEKESAELPQHAFWTSTDRLDTLEIAPGNLKIFQFLYEMRNDGEWISKIVKDSRGEYVQTEFRRKY